jgi:polyhydroxybutyrate depolymerase
MNPLSRLTLLFCFVLSLGASACSSDDDGGDGGGGTADAGTTADGMGADAAADDASDDTADDTAAPCDMPMALTDTIGGARPAKFVVPDDWDSCRADKYPLVLLIHGYGASGALQDILLGVSDRVNDKGYVAIVPEGLQDKGGSQFWNGGPCCDWDGIGVDDVGYLRSVIDEAVAKLHVDPERVYLYGHSNGGFMAMKMACEHADAITAIASLAGAAAAEAVDCGNTRPVHVLGMHGTGDKLIEYGGGIYKGLEYPSATETIEVWRELNACPNAPTSTDTADYLDTNNGTDTDITRWEGCADGTSVEHWKLHDGGHIPVINDDFRDAALDWLLDKRRD